MMCYVPRLETETLPGEEDLRKKKRKKKRLRYFEEHTSTHKFKQLFLCLVIPNLSY